MADQNSTPEEMGRTSAMPQHEWLNNLVGTWQTESEMYMDPASEPMRASGRETVVMLGGLWAFSEGESLFPDGGTMVYKSGLGFDVSFKEYRGFWIASMSSHLWKYVGELSEDGNTMTLNCEGPDMVKDGETALYRDVIEIISPDLRTMTSYGQDKASGDWVKFVKITYRRAM